MWVPVFLLLPVHPTSLFFPWTARVCRSSSSIDLISYCTNSLLSFPFDYSTLVYWLFLLLVCLMLPQSFSKFCLFYSFIYFPLPSCSYFHLCSSHFLICTVLEHHLLSNFGDLKNVLWWRGSCSLVPLPYTLMLLKLWITPKHYLGTFQIRTHMLEK